MTNDNESKDCILVVDDEEVVFMAIRDSLEDDYDLVYAENGEKGIEYIEEYAPALVILDYKMPKMNGADFLRSVQPSPDDPFSIIVLTGHARGQEIAECFDLGITAFLRKPFNVHELKGLVRQSIRLKQAEELLREKKYLEVALNTVAAIRNEVQDGMSRIALLRQRLAVLDGVNDEMLEIFDSGVSQITSVMEKAATIQKVLLSEAGGDTT